MTHLTPNQDFIYFDSSYAFIACNEPLRVYKYKQKHKRYLQLSQNLLSDWQKWLGSHSSYLSYGSSLK